MPCTLCIVVTDTHPRPRVQVLGRSGMGTMRVCVGLRGLSGSRANRRVRSAPAATRRCTSIRTSHATAATSIEVGAVDTRYRRALETPRTRLRRALNAPGLSVLGRRSSVVHPRLSVVLVVLVLVVLVVVVVSVSVPVAEVQDSRLETWIRKVSEGSYRGEENVPLGREVDAPPSQPHSIARRRRRHHVLSVVVESCHPS
jgi:hypothetical protein